MSLDIACRRRAEEVKILEAKRQYAKDHLNDGMTLGSLGPDYQRMALAQRDARAESIEEMTKQITALEGLGDDALLQRYCPLPSAELAALLEYGATFSDTLARGVAR